jgi:peptidoglycan/xylan/chitin deacetylase (PgdA/CDA1 family)
VTPSTARTPPAADVEPTVSAVIATTGRASLEDAVRSALAQTRPVIEVVVVFDGPLRPLDLEDAAVPVRVLTTAGWQGPSVARTMGIAAAHGTLVALLDDDDRWVPEKVAAQVQLWEDERRHVEDPVVVVLSQDVDPSGRELRPPRPTYYDPAVDDLADALFRVASLHWPWHRIALGASTILASRSLLLEQPFDPVRRIHEDWEWLLRVDRLPGSRVSVVDRRLLRYTVNPAGTSASSTGGQWQASESFARTAPMSDRARGDLLVSVTAPMALRNGELVHAARIARVSFQEGRPGVRAVTVAIGQALLTIPGIEALRERRRRRLADRYLDQCAVPATPAPPPPATGQTAGRGAARSPDATVPSADAVVRALGRAPVAASCRALTGGRLRVIGYHGVPDAERLAAHLDHVVRHYEPVSSAQVADALAGRTPLPRRAVWVTFDDGHRDVLDTGLPLLDAAGVPATLFVCPGYVEAPAPFWWDVAARAGGADAPVLDGQRMEGAALVHRLQRVDDAQRRAVLDGLATIAGSTATTAIGVDELRRWVASGRDVGNHTWDHPSLDRCDDRQVRDQITRAHEWLTVELGRAPTTFAYPHGHLDRRATAVLGQLGYAVGVLYDHHLARTDPGQRFELSRLRIDADEPIDRFAAVLSGSQPILLGAAGAVWRPRSASRGVAK